LKRILVIAAAVLALIPFSTLSQTKRESRDDMKVGGSFPSSNSIRARLKELVPDARNTGIVVGLLHPGGKRQVIAYGSSGLNARPLDGDSVFEIGSITKVFTGVLLADMMQRGEVKLSDPLARFLPPNVSAPSRDGKQITLLDLATHTSGLPPSPSNLPNAPQGYNAYTLQQMYDFLSGYELARAPGGADQYSNFFSLIGHALAFRSGKPYEALLRERILSPLKMEQTAVTLTPRMQRHLTQGHDRFGDPAPYFTPPAFVPSGGMKSTLNDMLDFAAANVAQNTAGIYGALRQAHRPQRPLGDSGEFWGLGWGIEPRENLIGHQGGTFGYNSFINIDLKNRRAVVVLTNVAGGDAGAIGAYLLDPAKYPLKKPSVVRAVAGVYRSGGIKEAIQQYRTLHSTARDGWNFAESELNDLGYWLLRRKSIADAIAVFTLNVEMYPESPNPYDSLGDALRAAGQLERAVENYRKAVALAEATNDPNLAGLRKTLESAIQQLNSAK